ncbi:MAG: tetratricopeptide repeat protein, partial [Phaeodactylibacter sp.]|nr:tetratricopeptide repeat protein [Phaeodactylibacter sp.]
MKYHLPKLWLLVACWLPFLATAQETTVYTEAYKAFKQGETAFEKGLYGKAQKQYQTALELLRPTNEGESALLQQKAELGFAKSAVRIGQPEGEKLMLDFIREYSPDPISNQALIELANYYYDLKKYDKALEYFAMVPTRSLTKDQRSEVRFKMGYAYFVRKDFAKAKSNFSEIKSVENEYFYPTNYYYGLCEFFLGNYDQAVQTFRVVEKSKRYQKHVPYYIAQIYFAEGDYDDLIAYAEPKLNDNNILKREELNQLVGQAYFEQGNYERALPYLEYYAERSGTLREEEFYQLGFAQYKVGAYSKAVKSFQPVGEVNSELGQYAMYYSGDAYLKLNNTKAAHTAFGKARKLPYDAFITEES